MNHVYLMCFPLLLHAAAHLTDAPPGGVGIRIGVFNHRIQRVYHGTPAEKVGLKPGDKVIGVTDDSNTHNIAGPANTEVVLIVKRDHAYMIFRVQRVPEGAIVRK